MDILGYLGYCCKIMSYNIFQDIYSTYSLKKKGMSRFVERKFKTFIVLATSSDIAYQIN
jgi:hypothetical protein